MITDQNGAAAAIVGLCTFQLWTAWNESAPGLPELRSVTSDKSDANNTAMRQKLHDAVLTVGSLALVVGIAMGVFTRKPDTLLLLASTLAILATWYYSILASEPNGVTL
jgi:hypothetical protein